MFFIDFKNKSDKGRFKVIKMVKFSVIIPVYNSGKYLKKCVDSIINQNYDNYEIIIINDGSTDDSLDYCNEIKNFCDKVFVYSQENQGQLPTRLKGVSLATGDYCLFLDSDDWFEADTFNKLSLKCQEYDADIFCFRIKTIYEFNEKYNKCSPEIFPEGTVFTDDKLPLIKLIFESCHLNAVTNKAVKTDLAKKSIIDTSKYTELRQGEDVLQAISLIKNANKIVFTNEAFYNYLIHGENITRQFISSKHFDINAVCCEILEFGKEYNITQEMIDGLYNSFSTKMLSYLVLLFKSELDLKAKKIILNEIENLSMFRLMKESGKIPTKLKLILKLPFLFNLYINFKR